MGSCPVLKMEHMKFTVQNIWTGQVLNALLDIFLAGLLKLCVLPVESGAINHVALVSA